MSDASTGSTDFLIAIGLVLSGVPTVAGVEGSELKLQRPGLFFSVTQEANGNAFTGGDRPDELVE